MVDFSVYLKKYHEQMAQSLCRCIQFPSVFAEDKSGFPFGKNVHDALVFMLELADKLGFKTCNVDNHIGWCEFGDGDEMVAVLGHLDVVPEGDGWDCAPYGGEIKDGKIFGRGAMDDKGPVISALYAMLAIKESAVFLKRRVRLIFGCNEETDSADIAYYLEHGGETPVMGFTPDGEYPLINGEKGLIIHSFAKKITQNGNTKIKNISGGEAVNIVPATAVAEISCDEKTATAIAEKVKKDASGKIKCRLANDGIKITAYGTSAHGAWPENGENAIGRLMMFLDTINFSDEMNAVIHLVATKIGMEWNGSSLGIACHDDISGDLTFNLGVLNFDGETMNVKLNYRYPVTFEKECCIPRIKEIFTEAGFSETKLSHKEKLYISEDSELVQKLLAVYNKATGQNAKPKCIGGGTYAKYMPNTLAFGPIFPGDEVREHKPNEFIKLEEIYKNAEIFANAIYELAM